MEFECRYIHDQDYNMALFRQIRWQNIGAYLFYFLFVAFSIFMAVLTFRQEKGMNLTTVIYIVFLVIALAAIVMPRIQVVRAWKKNCEKWGRDKFETTVTFGDSVRLVDDTGLEADIPWHRIAEVAKAGPFMVLRGEEIRGRKKKLTKVDYLYCPLSGFSDGTGQALRDWMKEYHPKIPITGWKS